jgi:hypothetical protein
MAGVTTEAVSIKIDDQTQTTDRPNNRLSPKQSKPSQTGTNSRLTRAGAVGAIEATAGTSIHSPLLGAMQQVDALPYRTVTAYLASISQTNSLTVFRRVLKRLILTSEPAEAVEMAMDDVTRTAIL